MKERNSWFGNVLSKKISTAFFTFVIAVLSSQLQARTAFVHLFEWQWNDIASECENFLGPKGFAAVQVSPPQKSVGGSQWWTRYQPVSYSIEGRSGSRAEFSSMVSRCKAVGVDIYVDAVINHMAAWDRNFPEVPYGPNDFHNCTDGIDYGNRWSIQNCDLVGLNDLDTSSWYVQQKIADYLNDLTSLGVAGFRIDAAKHMSASDIHIEPDEKILRIRQRVDGVLQENTLNQVKIASALVLRLKLMSGLDISEKRIPQDGRFNIKVKGHTLDVRVSTMPVANGEAVVMRLLDQSAGLLTLDQTGMPDAMAEKFRAAINRPHGMILVTGPTGSGKTTTLYGALSELNKPDLKIITAEDPIEYRLPRINQVQVNAKIGLDFAAILRTTLRQDPDIIMVGEMRDQETVEIGLRGALTGHLVLSTLHTNDSVTSAIRLIDMGAAPYLVATSLRGVLAQRLVRRVCENCKEEKPATAQEQAWVGFLKPELATATFYKGRGCNSCNHTGYKGRIGVFEFLEMNEDMMEALREDDTQGFVDATKANKDFVPLSHMALDYAAEGKTSLDEVFKVAEFVPEVVNH